MARLPHDCLDVSERAGWHPDLIELQLAHAERNEVRAPHITARSDRRSETMMQAWAAYSDRLRDGIPTNIGLQSTSAVIAERQH